MIGSHHPSTLGNSVFAAFAEVRPFYESILGQVRSGKTVTQECQLYPFVRNGTLEDAWFTFTYAPLCDESGAIVGVFSVMIEVTAQVLAEQRREASEARQAFLLKVADALRPVDDPIEVQSAAAAQI